MNTRDDVSDETNTKQNTDPLENTTDSNCDDIDQKHALRSKTRLEIVDHLWGKGRVDEVKKRTCGSKR